MGFEKGTKDKIKKKMLKIMQTKSTEIEQFGRKIMAEDIRKREATDTGLLLSQSLVSKFKMTDESATFQFGVKAIRYTEKNPTPAEYLPNRPPSSPPPRFSNTPLGTTVDAAIAVIWGLGVHAKKGARNFPRVAIINIISKYFGNINKLKTK